MIFRRVKQFFRAMTAKVTPEDGKYISAHLSPEEQELFFAMSVEDQCHSLKTAYTIERLVIEDKQGIDREFLIRCALLHDVGRVAGDISTLGKVFTVLVSDIAPGFADSLELKGNKQIYIYRHHAEIGGRKLQQLGLFREAKIVAKHHAPPSPDDPYELKLLRLADSEN